MEYINDKLERANEVLEYLAFLYVKNKTITDRDIFDVMLKVNRDFNPVEEIIEDVSCSFSGINYNGTACLLISGMGENSSNEIMISFNGEKVKKRVAAVDFIEVYNQKAKENDKNYTKELVANSKHEVIIYPKNGLHSSVVDYMAYFMLIHSIEGFIVIDKNCPSLGVKIYLKDMDKVIFISDYIETTNTKNIINKPNPLLPILGIVNVVSDKLQNRYLEMISKLLECYIKKTVTTDRNSRYLNLADFYEFICNNSFDELDISNELLNEFKISINKTLSETELEQNFFKILNKER